MEKKVNLFVVGAMRSGTTSLTRLLSKHSDVYFSPIKEPHFFVNTLPIRLYEPSRFFSLKKYFEKEFPNYLHIAKVEDKAQYDKLFSLATTQQILAEASTSYLHEPNAAYNLQKYNPDAKIVIILRNPIKRAFSHYNMDRALGHEMESFTSIIQKELKAVKEGGLPWYSHLNMSFYNEPVALYRSLFDKVHVIRLEDITVNFDQEIEKLADFLEIDAFIANNFAHRNKTRSVPIQGTLNRLKKMGLKDYFSKWVPSGIKRSLFKVISREISDEISLPDSIASELDALFSGKSGGFLSLIKWSKK